MQLADYLKFSETIIARPEQQEWFRRLRRQAEAGRQAYAGADQTTRQRLHDDLRDRIRTEELKAIYSFPDRGDLFQGTSISALTVPHETPAPLTFNGMADLEEQLADAYIAAHRRLAPRVRACCLEPVDRWLAGGLFHGVVLGSKLVAQALGLAVASGEVVFDVAGRTVDPHEILSYPEDIRQRYFERCRQSLPVFAGLEVERREVEASLVLADISKPKLERYRDRIILAPIRCNELAAIIAERVMQLITEKTAGEIRPRGLTVVIYDTDSPYTYYRVMGYNRRQLSPLLPGLIVLGASGTCDAFRWLYPYRVSLIAQQMMKSSMWSQAHGSFIPFVFLGVLVPRNADIMLDLDRLHQLRYRGNFDPEVEYTYTLGSALQYLAEPAPEFSWDGFSRSHGPDR